jgi:hypothetical protein
MIEAEIIERIQRLPFGGIISANNRLSDLYVRTLLNTFRAQIIRTIYQKDKRINPECYQKFYPVFNADFQDTKCVVKFQCPEVIALDSNSDGFRYIGTIDCSQEFRRIRTRSMLSTINRHQVMSVKTGIYTGVLYDGSAQVLEVYGNDDIEEMLVEGIFIDPNQIPTYNPKFDQYPLNDDLIPMVEDMILKSQTALEAGTTPDYTNQETQVAGGGRRR